MGRTKLFLFFSSVLVLFLAQTSISARADNCANGNGGTCHQTTNDTCPTGYSSGGQSSSCPSGSICCLKLLGDDGNSYQTSAGTNTGSTTTNNTGTNTGTSTTSTSTDGASTEKCKDGFEEYAGVCFPKKEKTGLSEASVKDILTNFGKWVFSIFGVIAVIIFVICGAQYFMAGVDEDMAERAKRCMMYSAIGVIVALSALVIIFFVDSLVNAGL